jgi:hypothetical protein
VAYVISGRVLIDNQLILPIVPMYALLLGRPRLIKPPKRRQLHKSKYDARSKDLIHKFQHNSDIEEAGCI